MHAAWFGIELHNLLCGSSRVLASTARNLIEWDSLYKLSKAAVRTGLQVTESFRFSSIEEIYDIRSVRPSEVIPPA
jgi:hypothetical protein